ncbi:hypothetical protein ACHAXA_000887 [Cyclostephanos tholiformis]|uniref:Uncharacterized protein n=1 Tax=Cyclostephanos tholiformis TaxID=382380 RepID=A0ABD3R6M8_9STRA
MSRRSPRSPKRGLDDEERGMINHRDGYDGAEESRQSSQLNIGDVSISPSRAFSSPIPGREGGSAGGRTNRPRNLSDASSSLNSSDSEVLDVVSELAPLVGGNSRHAYESIDDQRDHHRAALAGLSDDESIHTVTALPDMEIRCHSISSNNSAGRRGHCSIRPSTAKVALRAVQHERRLAKKREQQNLPLGPTTQPPAADAIAGTSHSKESYWIDIETHQRSTDELYDFLRQLHLPPFFVSILSEPATWTSEVIALKLVSLAIFQILPIDTSSTEVAHVALLSMPRLLVTFSTYPQRNEAEGMYQMVTQYLRQRERVPEPTSSGVLLAWLTFHVRRTARAVRALRLATVAMDEAMDTDPPTFEFEHLVEAKNCLLRVLQVAEEQDNMIEGLAAAEKNTVGLDFTTCRGAFSMLEANSKSNERLSSRVDKHMNELRERIMAKREVDLNQRLALLTILTAIFMPLTLLTGIWGMNFDYMPELSAEGAYYKALFGMLILALTLVYCFHRAGWSRI